MGDLPITELKKEKAESMDLSKHSITLKYDGTLIYFKNGKLFSPRCERSERFEHILTTLKQNDFPECYGEMYFNEDSNVFDVSRSENWRSCKFMPIDILNNQISYNQRQEFLKKKVTEVNSLFITELKKFDSFDEGWDYVVKNNREGLVIRNDRDFFKVKKLREVKEEIIGHEKGTSLKGTFILKSGNRVSGTSDQYVLNYLAIKQRGKRAIAELEFPFITESGKYFQSRLRRIYEEM